jgi:[ribosomal protein S5]-alanine N-acetyltransferase
MMIETERLWLVVADLPKLEAIVSEDQDTLSSLLGGVDIASQWLHFPEAMVWMRDYLRESEAELGWWNYLIIHRQAGKLIGSGGFKGPPSYNGEVEIGYEIAPAYQGQGLATEAARALVEYAFNNTAVRCVMANTLAEENASNHLLYKIGFEWMGEEEDLEETKFWVFRQLKIGEKP